MGKSSGVGCELQGVRGHESRGIVMRQSGVAAVCAGLFLLVPVLAEDPADIPDPALKAAIEEALGVENPTPTDMLGLAELVAPMKRITDLTGLQYAANLRWLDLSRGNDNGGVGIWDISPLAGLISLEHLDLNNNYISDISALSGMDLLEYLDVHDNRISDLSPLAGKTRLHTAYLYRQFDQTGDLLSDISVLAGLPNLTILNLRDNNISDLSPLLSLGSLEYLDVDLNPLSDEACTFHIPQILANNPDATLLYSCGLPQLTLSSTPGGFITDPGEGTFTYSYGRIVPVEAKADPGFVFSHWSGTHYSTLNPTSVTMDRDHEVRAHFLSAQEVLVVDDDAPADPAPGDVAVSDPQEDGTPAHPLDSIQEAIEVASHKTTIVVRPGTYRECINFLGKQIHLTGIDPEDPGTASYPVIDGHGRAPVVRFIHGEDPHCTLTGFVITGGLGPQTGAIACVDSSPTLTHCLIVGNRATDVQGAAVLCENSGATFVNCTMADNRGGALGACLSLVNSPVVMTNSIVWGNRPKELLLILKDAERPTITYTDMASGPGGLGTIDADPLFVRRGHWADPDDANREVDPSDPEAVWIDGDYHVRSQAGRWDWIAGTWVKDEVTSPCVDAGDPADPVGHEPVPHGGILNMGAYGGTAQASKSSTHP